MRKRSPADLLSRERQAAADALGVSSGARSTGAAALLCLSLALACPADHAEAQSPEASAAVDDDLEYRLLGELPRVITAAAFREQLPEEAPAAVIVVTASDIRASGARTLGEALERCAGVGLQTQSLLYIRGVGSTNRIGGVGDAGRVLLLIDGTRINDVFTDNFEVGLNRGVHDINRIEIVKGPGSALYGTSAFAGVINVVTLKGGDQPGGQAWLRAGPTDLTTSVQAGRVVGQTELAGHARVTAIPEVPLGPQFGELRASLSRKGISANLGYGVLQGEVWTDEEPHEQEGPPPPPGRPRRQEVYGALQGEKAFTPRVHTLIRASSTAGERHLPSSGIDVREARLATEGRLRVRLSPMVWGTVGGEVRREVARLTDEAQASTDLSRAVGGTYAQVEVGPFLWTTLTAGIRAERISPVAEGVFSRVYDTLTPRVGLVTSLPTATVFKLFYGEAVQAPSLALLYTDTEVREVTLLSNAQLVPEQLSSFEAEVSQRVGGTVNLRLNAFVDDVDNFINAGYTQTQNVLQFENASNQARIRGLEAEVSYTPSARVGGFANLTVLDAYDRVTYTNLPLVPRYEGNVGIKARPVSRVYGFASASYVSERVGTEGNPLSEFLLLPAQLRVDARVAVDVGERWQLSVTARNVVGTPGSDFSESQLVEGPGRQLWLEVSLSPPSPTRGGGAL